MVILETIMCNYDKIFDKQTDEELKQAINSLLKEAYMIAAGKIKSATFEEIFKAGG